ncbi:hypothetical protein K474DRAFT_1711647 [Panus rudis PR-1116 ss-1]|nr:hypothetical protein K474DRAFT_1711647 [Panus rudis PR-1116 ss-1]
MDDADTALAASVPLDSLEMMLNAMPGYLGRITVPGAEVYKRKHIDLQRTSATASIPMKTWFPDPFPPTSCILAPEKSQYRDDILKDMQRHKEAAEEHRKEYMALLSGLNFLAPINAIPPEIFLQIIKQCLVSSGHVFDPGYEGLLQLTLVCRHWRLHILGCGTLWNRIDSRMSPAKVQALFRLSGDTPLRVLFWGTPKWHGFQEMVVRNGARLQYFIESWQQSDIFPRLLKDGVLCPALLGITLHGLTMDAREYPQLFPNLRSLTVYNMTANDICSFIRTAPCIEHLDLTSPDITLNAESNMAPMQLFDVLSAVPRLHELSLRGISFKPWVPERERDALPLWSLSDLMMETDFESSDVILRSLLLRPSVYLDLSCLACLDKLGDILPCIPRLGTSIANIYGSDIDAFRTVVVEADAEEYYDQLRSVFTIKASRSHPVDCVSGGGLHVLDDGFKITMDLHPQQSRDNRIVPHCHNALLSSNMSSLYSGVETLLIVMDDRRFSSQRLRRFVLAKAKNLRSISVSSQTLTLAVGTVVKCLGRPSAEHENSAATSGADAILCPYLRDVTIAWKERDFRSLAEEPTLWTALLNILCHRKDMGYQLEELHIVHDANDGAESKVSWNAFRSVVRSLVISGCYRS